MFPGDTAELGAELANTTGYVVSSVTSSNPAVTVADPSDGMDGGTRNTYASAASMAGDPGSAGPITITLTPAARAATLEVTLVKSKNEDTRYGYTERPVVTATAVPLEGDTISQDRYTYTFAWKIYEGLGHVLWEDAAEDNVSVYQAPTGYSANDNERYYKVQCTVTATCGDNGQTVTSKTQTVYLQIGRAFVDGEGSDYTVTGTQTAAGSSGNTFTYTLKAGTASVTITGQGNYDETITKTFQITPAELTVTTPIRDKEYDGRALTVAGSLEGLVNGETAGFRTTGTQTLAGSSENTYELVFQAPDNGYTAKAGNYTVSEDLGTLEVRDRAEKYEITVVSNSRAETYDGTERAVGGFETLNFTVDGVAYTVEGLTAEVRRTDAGIYANAITGTAAVKDSGGHDVTEQFTVHQR